MGVCFFSPLLQINCLYIITVSDGFVILSVSNELPVPGFCFKLIVCTFCQVLISYLYLYIFFVSDELYGSGLVNNIVQGLDMVLNISLSCFRIIYGPKYFILYILYMQCLGPALRV